MSFKKSLAGGGSEVHPSFAAELACVQVPPHLTAAVLLPLLTAQSSITPHRPDHSFSFSASSLSHSQRPVRLRFSVQTIFPPCCSTPEQVLPVLLASAQARQLLLISAPGISLIALLVVAPSSRARERMTESSREDDRKSIERGCPQERTIQKRGLVGRRHRTGRRHTQTCTHAYTHARIHKCKHAH